MISPEKEQLATLLLARHILLARAAELDARHEAMAALHSAPYDRIRPSPDDESNIRQRLEGLNAQMSMFPPLLVYLEQRIRKACRRG